MTASVYLIFIFVEFLSTFSVDVAEKLYYLLGGTWGTTRGHMK